MTQETPREAATPLAKLRVLSDAATPGPWEDTDHRSAIAVGRPRSPFGHAIVYADTYDEPARANREFIVAAVNYVRDLLRSEGTDSAESAVALREALGETER